MCMVMRGEQKMNACTVTSAVLERFHYDPKTRKFLAKDKVNSFYIGRQSTVGICSNKQHLFICASLPVALREALVMSFLVFCIDLSCLNATYKECLSQHIVEIKLQKW